jgi:hypothetical protein
MPRPRSAFLALLGIAVAIAAIELVDHPALVPNGGPIAAVLIGIALVLLGVGFIDVMGHARQSAPPPGPVPTPPPAGPPTIYTLRIGRTYRVRRAFEDHYREPFAVDELLTYRDRSFIPYHGGHTLMFVERGMWLQEDDQRPIIDAFDDYLEPVAHDPRPGPVDPEDHATLNAVIAELPATVSDEVVYEIAGRHGTRVAVSIRRLVDDVIAAPVDWRTASVDDGLRAMHDLIRDRYPWLDEAARGRLAHVFTMTWK